MTFFDIFHSTRLICAHRGFRAHRPENTLSAFKASIGRCHFIELDIQMSKDSIPMVIHDPILSRTSDVEIKRHRLGLNSLDVHNWNMIQLKTLDMGSWFIKRDPFSTLCRKELSVEQLTAEMPQTMMTLEEFLLHPALRTTPVNIEIKDHSNNRHDKTVVKAVVKTIEKTLSKERVLISSFRHDYLVSIKKIVPEITTAALQRDRNPPDLLEYMKSLGVAAYHPSKEITDRALIALLRSAGFFVNIFTVNNKQKQNELFQQGATAMITDYPKIT